MDKLNNVIKGKKAIVVGAGLSGLSAAYRLQQKGWKVKVLEASSRIGGRVQTDFKDGYIIDTGASALSSSYHAYINLAKELGIGNRLVSTSAVVSIPREGQLYELDTLKMMTEGMTTGLLSWQAKLRMTRLVVDVVVAKMRGLLDYADMGKAAPLDTESAASYAKRVLGSELNDYLCSPLVRVMLIASAEDITKVELFSAIANIFGAKMMALQGGVNEFAQVLSQGLDVDLSCTVKDVKESDSAVEVVWDNAQGVQCSEMVDACVVACTLPEARKMCSDYQYLLVPLDDAIQYTSTITVSLGTTVEPKTDAFVIPLPECESPEVALLFMDHNKCSDRSPEGRYLINSHWDNTASKKNMGMDDDVLIKRTIEQVARLFPEVKDNIEMTHVGRWQNALPMTTVGSYRAIQTFTSQLDVSKRVQFAADYMSAAGQNTAVTFGERAAENLVQYF